MIVTAFFELWQLTIKIIRGKVILHSLGGTIKLGPFLCVYFQQECMKYASQDIIVESQISPLSTGPNLVVENSTSFATFLRLVPSDVAAAMGVVSLMEQFNWTRLGLITQQESSFTFVSNAIDMHNTRTLCLHSDYTALEPKPASQCDTAHKHQPCTQKPMLHRRYA